MEPDVGAYEISGLHVHITFEEAVAHAEKLGGVCQLGNLRRGEVLTAQCDYTACQDDTSGIPCSEAVQEARPFAVVAQPVTTVGLEANAGAPGLTRISFIYDGDSQVVRESLMERFGPPRNDDSDYSDATWTHGRRLHWRSGDDGMGLMMTVKVITLSGRAAFPESDAKDAP